MIEKKTIEQKHHKIAVKSMHALLKELNSKQINPQQIISVCLVVLLSYALKFSPNKYVIFGLIANSMKSAFEANQEYNRRYSFDLEDRENREDREDREDREERGDKVKILH